MTTLASLRGVGIAVWSMIRRLLCAPARASVLDSQGRSGHHRDRTDAVVIRRIGISGNCVNALELDATKVGMGSPVRAAPKTDQSRRRLRYGPSRVPSVPSITSSRKDRRNSSAWRAWEAGGLPETARGARSSHPRCDQDAGGSGPADRYGRRVSPRRLVARLSQCGRRLRLPSLEARFPKRRWIYDGVAGSGRDQDKCAAPGQSSPRTSSSSTRLRVHSRRSRCRRRHTCTSVISRMPSIPRSIRTSKPIGTT